MNKWKPKVKNHAEFKRKIAELKEKYKDDVTVIKLPGYGEVSWVNIPQEEIRKLLPDGVVERTDKLLEEFNRVL